MFECPILIDGWMAGALVVGRRVHLEKRSLQQQQHAAVQSRDSSWRRRLVSALPNQPSAPVKPLDSSPFHQDPAPHVVQMGGCDGAGSCSLYRTAEGRVEKSNQGPRPSNVEPVRVPGRRGHRM
jgi:hypothetical protein